MQAYTTIQNLRDRTGETVEFRGWLCGKRTAGQLIFALVRDGTGICQCVIEARTAGAFAAAGKAPLECSVVVHGVPRADERAPGGIELSVSDFTVLQGAEGYPIARKEHGVDFLMNRRHLWLRSQRQTAILRVRHTLIAAARRFFDERGFTLVDTPIFQPSAAEGAGSLFPVEYFGERVFLAQTGQLYLEAAAMALGRVYCFGPTFRAEKSKTRRHLTEFWMVEPEIAFAELPDLTDLAEAFVTRLVEAALTERREELKRLERDLSPLERIAPPFPRLTYTEAVEHLRSDDVHRRLNAKLEADRARLAEGMQRLEDLERQRRAATQARRQAQLDSEIEARREELRELEEDLVTRPAHIESARQFRWGEDFGGDEETILARQFDRPVIVTHYPRSCKAFYMKPAPDDPRVVLNFDLLAPEGYGEIIGGSQREDDLEALRARLAEEGMDAGPYEWYLDLRRYGSVPHGGFGLGVERTVAWICGLRHIRETIPFPRLVGRATP
jgi:asparaginyl-tRNA synthetase